MKGNSEGKTVKNISEMSLEEVMKELFGEGQFPVFGTGMEIWELIEGLGGIIFYTEHDAADGRISLNAEDDRRLSLMKQMSRKLLEKLRDEYGIIPPQEYPKVESLRDLPPAPEGKKYYWDWYRETSAIYYKEEYERIICSACALHEENGAEAMRGHVPCGIFPGMLYHLTYPWLCGMLKDGRCGWLTPEELLQEIREKGGEEAVKAYKDKLLTLKNAWADNLVAEISKMLSGEVEIDAEALYMKIRTLAREGCNDWLNKISFGSIKDVVSIPGIGLYAKTSEALERLFAFLKARGYEIEDTSISKGEPGSIGYRPSREVLEKKGSSLWYARLRDDVVVRRGKCRSCGSYIDTRGIQSHKHKCEKCGAYTYLDFDLGSIIRFSFISREDGRLGANVTMKVYGYDEEQKLLLLFPDPLDGKGYFDCTKKEALKVLEENKDKWFKTRRNGVIYIAVHHNPYTGFKEPEDVISVYEIHGRYHNYSIIKLYEGKEYGDYESLPVPESYSIWEAWHWAPLGSSSTLHETIISAGGMVSRPSYYYQDGRTAFYEINLIRMRLFVQNFTDLNIERWDRMIARAPKDGPGMIRAIANFCSDNPQVDRTPSIGNVLIGVSKALGGERLTRGEVAEMENALADEETRGEAVDFFSSLVSSKKKP